MLIKKKHLTITLITVILSLFSGSSVLAASAATDNTTLFPQAVTDLMNLLGVNGICTSKFISSRMQLGLFLAMGGIVLLAVINIIIAAFRYIISMGDTEKIKKANRSIGGVLLGIVMLVLSLAGIVLVYTFLGNRPTMPVLFQTCISSVESEGCQECLRDPKSNRCLRCESSYELACNSNLTPEDLQRQLDKQGLSYCYLNKH